MVDLSTIRKVVAIVVTTPIMNSRLNVRSYLSTFYIAILIHLQIYLTASDKVRNIFDLKNKM